MTIAPTTVATTVPAGATCGAPTVAASGWACSKSGDERPPPPPPPSHLYSCCRCWRPCPSNLLSSEPNSHEVSRLLPLKNRQPEHDDAYETHNTQGNATGTTLRNSESAHNTDLWQRITPQNRNPHTPHTLRKIGTVNCCTFRAKHKKKKRYKMRKR